MTELPCRVQRPEGPGPYPTIVLVHGRAGDENVMWVFARALPPGTLVVSPRAPLVDPQEGGYSWFEPGNPASVERGRDALLDSLDHLAERYNADPGRVVLVGFSQGAAVSYAVSWKAPSRIIGVAALSGFLPSICTRANAPLDLAGVRFLIAHGRADKTLLIDEARRACDILTALGVDVEYFEHPLGHKLSSAGTHALEAWLREVLGTG